MMQHAIMEYLLNALWQVPLLAAGGWFLIRMVRPAAQLQHCVWLAVLAAAVLLPLHGMGNIDDSVPYPTQLLSGQHDSKQPPAALPAQQHQPLGSWFPGTHTVRIGPRYMQWLVRLYLATVVFALLRIAQAWRAAWLLAARASQTSAHQAAVARHSRRFGIQPPDTRESPAIASPMIAGIVSQRLLLPVDFARFSEEQISAAICHELAHIRRRDPLVNLGCQLAMAPLLWHPAMQLIQRRIRMTREMACDALAAEQMNSQLNYARCLLALAHSMLGDRRATLRNQHIALLGNNTLEERIMRLTEKTTTNLRAQVSRAAVGVAMMSASCVLAATLHLEPNVQLPVQAAPASPAASPTMDAQAPAPAVSQPAPADKTRQEERSVHARQRAEVRQQMEAARRQAATAAAMFNSQAFQKQMEDAQHQAQSARSLMDSPQFKQQMEEAQRQAAKARDLVNSPQFKQQMEEARRQAEQARAMVDTPAFRKQMEEAKRQAFAAKELFDSEQFNRQMEEVQRKIGEAMKDFHPEMTPAPPAP